MIVCQLVETRKDRGIDNHPFGELVEIQARAQPAVLVSQINADESAMELSGEVQHLNVENASMERLRLAPAISRARPAHGQSVADFSERGVGTDEVRRLALDSGEMRSAEPVQANAAQGVEKLSVIAIGADRERVWRQLPGVSYHDSGAARCAMKVQRWRV